MKPSRHGAFTGARSSLIAFLPLLLLGLITSGCQILSEVKSATHAIEDAGSVIEEATLGVESIDQAIDKALPTLAAATHDIEEAGEAVSEVDQAVTQALPTVKAAQHSIEEAAGTIAATTPAIETAIAALARSTLAIEQSSASLESIGEIMLVTTEIIQKAKHIVQQSSQGIEANRTIIEASTASIAANVTTVEQSTVSLGRIGNELDNILTTWDRLTASNGLIWTLIAAGMTLILIPSLFFSIFLWKLMRLVHTLSNRIEELPDPAATSSPPR